MQTCALTADSRISASVVAVRWLNSRQIRLCSNTPWDTQIDFGRERSHLHPIKPSQGQSLGSPPPKIGILRTDANYACEVILILKKLNLNSPKYGLSGTSDAAIAPLN